MSVATNSGFVSDAWLPRRRTLVLVGHLPHAGGTWLSQFADREAVDFGPVCLLRPSEEGTQISVYRAKRGALTLGSYPSIEVALNEIAASVARWMVVARTTATIEIPEGTDDIVVLTAVHQSAVYHAESIVMRCLDVLSSRPAPRPGLSVVVLGATAEEHALVAARISDSIGPPNAALIDVRRSVQRVGPVQHLEGEAAGPVASLARLYKSIDEVESGPLSPADTTSPSKAESMPEPRLNRFESNASRQAPSAGFSAPAAPSAHVGSPAHPPRRDDGPLPFRQIEPAPTRVGRGSEPVRTPPSSAVEPRDDAWARRTIESASETIRAAGAASPASTRDAYYASSVSGPAARTPTAKVVETAYPESLSEHLSGLEKIPHVAPRCERIELAVSADGRLHVACRVDDMLMLQRARLWLRENGALLCRAYPVIRSAEDFVVHVFVRNVADAQPIEGAEMHLAQLVEIQGRRGWLVQQLAF